jgi:hypothetical protein
MKNNSTNPVPSIPPVPYLVPHLIVEKLLRSNQVSKSNVAIADLPCAFRLFNASETHVLMTNQVTGANFKLYRPRATKAGAIRYSVAIMVRNSKGEVIFHKKYIKLISLLKWYWHELQATPTTSKYKFELLGGN